MSFFEPKMPTMFTHLSLLFTRISMDTEEDPPTLYHAREVYTDITTSINDPRMLIQFYNSKRLYVLRCKRGKRDTKHGIILDIRFKERSSEKIDHSSFSREGDWEIIEETFLDSKWSKDETPFRVLIDFLKIFNKE